MGIVLFIIFALILLASVPAWPHSRKWGYYPSCGLGVVLVVLVVLVLTGHMQI